MLLSGLASIALLTWFSPPTEAQVKFEASFFVHIYNYAGYQKLFNLAKGLNGDSNLAARKKRMQNWHKNNFGTMSTKSFTPLDNKTQVLNQALQFLEYREAISKMIKNCAQTVLTKEYGASLSKKIIDRFWILDRMYDGVAHGAAMYDSVGLIYREVAAGKRNGLSDVTYKIENESLNDDKKGGRILLDYLPHKLSSYPWLGPVVPGFG